ARADHKDHADPSKSFRNDFSSAKSCAALVGDSRTLSLPSSVHIPSINSPQSLPLPGDEVFKEIQDVGEYNSVSSFHLFFGNMDLPPSSYHDSLEELWDEEEKPEEVETVMKAVPSTYHQFLDVFSKVKAEKLSSHCACDHHIELEESLPPVGVIYSLSKQESDTLRAYISENVEKCFSHPSSSSTGAPVLFVKKKDGGLRLCVYYCKLNAVTRKNKYPVPPINQFLNFFYGSFIFSKIDLRGAYNLLRIKEGDEHLTCFRTKYASYEYLVVPFGLTNAPAFFHNLVNDIFQDLLDVYVVFNLDDIMVFSKSEEEHVTHVSTVLFRLRANNLFSKASKCLFHASSVDYLGYGVSSEGLKMDQAKVQQILNWPPPRTLKALQSFLGFSNFYHHFIKNYSKKISSLTSFLKKDSCFPLNEESLSQFCQIKEAFITAPVLSHFNHSLPTISLLAVKPTGLNSSLNFISQSLTALDALSPRDNVYPERGEDFISKNPMNFQQLIKQDEVQPSRYFAVKVEYFSNLIDSIQKKLWQDPQYRSILEELGKDQVVVPNDPTIQLSILQKRHDSPLAGHPGQVKTLKLVKWDFHWSGMTQLIKDYVLSCQQCSRNNNIHHKKFGLLKPLPIPNGPCICLSMDFITPLPLSNSFDSILVIVDRFSKMAVFIPKPSSITSLDLAHLFIKNIFSKNGLPSGITERVNQILEKYLWLYVSYHQDDWNTWLPLAEFAYNNSDQSSTKQSLFFTVYGRDPQFDSAHITQDTLAGKLSKKIQSVQQGVKRGLEVAINRFKRYADKGRASPPVFNPGDMVWLSSKNIKSSRPTKQLSERWLGPFPILKKVITHAYHPKLPSHWKSIHPGFHLSLLEPVKTSTIGNRHQEPPPPITIEEEEE
ncbi:hypothetical protein O181_047111, partial [Austropuccinia psidii MF-1]|nr:hypothetical protein [Austropuccinia psidii MF-1]